METVVAGTPRAAAAVRPAWLLGVLMLGYLLNAVDRALPAVLLEPIRHTFGASDTQLGLLTGFVFGLVYSLAGVPIAAYTDRGCRRCVLALALLFWSTTTALGGAATSFAWLLAMRIGTGIGEAGGSPPSHSLIVEHFPPARRATALALYSLGAPAGAAVAGLWGGFGNEWLGWRGTFIATGLAGLLVVPLIAWTLPRDPPPVARERPSLSFGAWSKTLLTPWSNPCWTHLWLACALHATAQHSTANFAVSFFMRSHDWQTSQAGLLLGVSGLVGAAGTVAGGFFADRRVQRSGDARWLVWVPGATTLLAAPLQVMGYLSPSALTAATLLTIVSGLMNMFFGPSFAAAQGITGATQRAMTTALMLLALSLVGQGVGPLLTGVTSDLLSARFGEQSLRHALLLAPVLNVWSAVHYLLAARGLRARLAAGA